MKIRTQRQLIQAVAKRWRQQYQPFKPDAILHGGKTKQEIADALDKLDGDTATAEDVNAIIGNDSWTDLKCDECKEYVTATIEVGDEPDYESHTAELCLNCAEKAAALIRGMRVQSDGEGEKPREQSGAGSASNGVQVPDSGTRS